ncbi:MAG: PKD domain-containing protein [Planctomycetes bacterium]|nr:PKD domain-containing protein [Planctomycetota bacterium]
MLESRSLRLLRPLALLLALTALARVGQAQCQTASFTGAAGPVGGLVAFDGDTLAFSTWGHIEIFRRQGAVWNSEQVMDFSSARAIALSGDTLVLSNPYEDQAGEAWVGKAQIYERNAGVWNLVQELLPSSPVSYSFFGTGVALEGDTLAVAQDAWYSDVGYGSVHVFVRAGGVWTRQAEWPCPLVWSDIATCMALDGERLLVGVPGFLTNPGQAFLYERTGSTWNQIQRFAQGDGTQWDIFGWFLALDGGTVVISSGLSSTYPYASLYVYEEAAGSWPLVAHLPGNPSNDWGMQPSLQGERLLAGEWKNADAGTNAGAVRVYRRLAGVWTATDKLYGADTRADDQFGRTLAQSQGYLAVGSWARGQAYVFALDDPACPDAAFSAAPTSGPAPLPVAFTDESGGGVTDWSWDFGDGGSSFAQHPGHTYAAAGRYRVELLATGLAGTDREIQPGLVFVGHAASATSRNGSGVNPPCLVSTSLPQIGGTWTAEIDTSAHAGATATLLLGWTRPSPGWLTRYGEFLIDLRSRKLFSSPAVPDASGVAHYSFPIPNDLALDGFTLSTQGGALGGLPELCNAVDLVTGF